MNIMEILKGVFNGLIHRWFYIFLPYPKTRYLIVSGGRTGSNFLVSLLSSHPSIHSRGEVIGESRIRYKRFRIEIQICKPIRYIKNCYRKFYMIKVVGCKVLYYQFMKPYADGWHMKNLDTILDSIKSDKNIKIIHLKRRNRLKTLASMERAARTKEYAIFNPDTKPQDISIELSAQRCTDFFNKREQTEKEFDDYFKDHKKLEVFYEDLASNMEQTYATILDFLQLPQHPLKAKTHKQSQKSLRESIKNYLELKDHFADTQWNAYFED